ncbi:MAG TPA: AAA family ATPase [Phycisphaerae bacterium]|nr:AAA family ATPase [Phycisphaerae bacterium]
MIRSVEVGGYRLLDGFKADFGPMTVVIGANATGKSTLLDFLQLVAQSVEFPLADVFSWHGGLLSICNAASDSGRLSWGIRFRKPPYNPFWGQVTALADREFVFEVAIERDAYWQPAAIHEVLRNVTPDAGHGQPLKYLESHPNRSLIFDRSKRRLVPFDEVVKQSKTDAEPAEAAPIAAPKAAQWTAPAMPATTLRLAQMRFVNEYPVPSWIRFLLAGIRTYPGFNVGRLAPVRTQPADIKPETLLLQSGENLGNVLHEILTRHDYRESAEQLREFLRAAYPSFDEINAETAYGATGKVLVRLREKGMNRPMELWDLSDGVLRFLCLAASLLNPWPPPVIVIDEPEVGLHPRLLPIVADMLKTASERAQVLVTTHSPDLLNCFGLDQIAVIAREGARAEWRRPGTRQSLRQMLENVIGETLGDLHRSGELEALE